jgi:hypothetical protein
MFKIKGKAKGIIAEHEAEFHQLLLGDSTSKIYVLEYQGDGWYVATEVVTSTAVSRNTVKIRYSRIRDMIKRSEWRLIRNHQ